MLALNKLLGVTAVIAAVDVVLLTVLATLGAFLYNLCATFTGGIEVTLASASRRSVRSGRAGAATADGAAWRRAPRGPVAQLVRAHP